MMPRSQEDLDLATAPVVNREVGDVFGSYVLQERLPGGGDFAVYAAQHQRFEQEVLLRVAFSVSTPAHAPGLHLLDHRGIERVLDQGRTGDGLAYTVSERVRGATAELYCARKKLDVADRTRLLLQVVDAIGYAHRHFHAHGRLRPENLLVNDAGEVKVCGFDAPQGDTSEKDALADDVRCLGNICAELLCGTSATTGAMTAALAAQSVTLQQQAAQARGTTVAKLKRALRGDLDAVVDRARKNDVLRGYASVDLLGVDLARTLKGRSTSAYDADRWEQLQRWVRFQPTTASAIALLALTAVGASASFLHQTAALNRQRKQAESRMATLVGMTGTLATGLYTAAGTLPRPAPVRAALLNRTRQTLDTATAEGELNPALANIVSRQYEELARRSMELGDTEAARVELARAASMQAHGHLHLPGR